MGALIRNGRSRGRDWARAGIGDDVVDLGMTLRSPHVQSAFDQRVYTAIERARIAQAADQARERWLHWAAKEAAYKALSKGSEVPAFHPSAFEVRWRVGVPLGRGCVAHGAQRVSVRWTEGPGWVHCLAAAGWAKSVRARARVRASVWPVPAARASRDARALARTLLRRTGARGRIVLDPMHGPGGPLRVRGGLDFDLSLSHDGRFVSAAACRRTGLPARRPRAAARGARP